MIPILVNPFGLLLCSCINPCCLPANLFVFLSGIFAIVLIVLALVGWACFGCFLSILCVIFCLCPLLCLASIYYPLIYCCYVVPTVLVTLISYIPSMPCLSQLLTTLECTRDIPTVFNRATCGLVNIF